MAKPDDAHRRRYTYEEAAAYTGVSERTLRAAYSTGKLKGAHVGRRREFTLAQLDAYLDLVGQTPDPRLKR